MMQAAVKADRHDLPIRQRHRCALTFDGSKVGALPIPPVIVNVQRATDLATVAAKAKIDPAFAALVRLLGVA